MHAIGKYRKALIMCREISVLPAASVAASQPPLFHGWLLPLGLQLPAVLLPAASWMKQTGTAGSSPPPAGSPTPLPGIGRST